MSSSLRAEACLIVGLMEVVRSRHIPLNRIFQFTRLNKNYIQIPI